MDESDFLLVVFLFFWIFVKWINCKKVSFICEIWNSCRNVLDGVMYLYVFICNVFLGLELYFWYSVYVVDVKRNIVINFLILFVNCWNWYFKGNVKKW